MGFVYITCFVLWFILLLIAGCDLFVLLIGLVGLVGYW